MCYVFQQNNKYFKNYSYSLKHIFLLQQNMFSVNTYLHNCFLLKKSMLFGIFSIAKFFSLIVFEFINKKY